MTRHGGSEPFARTRAPLCAVILTYVADLDAIDAAMADHVDWLRAGYEAGVIVASGRRVPRTGGVIVFRGDEAAVRAAVDADPFVARELATAEVVAFTASMVAPALADLVASMLALIDYQAGNLHSVANALRAAGGEPTITADPDAVARADRIVLPGVGAFGACAAGLRAVPGLVDALERRVRGQGAPFLGICVGMQLLADVGEEHGEHPGLGWVPGRVRRLAPVDPAAKVPHMGWNDVRPVAAHPLIEPGEAYFLHGYAFEGEEVVATTDHAGPVTAAVGRDNVVGVQFHPEKSQRYGLALLERFLAWRP